MISAFHHRSYARLVQGAAFFAALATGPAAQAQSYPAPAQAIEPEPARYGDQGTSHAGLGLGLGSGSGGTRYAAGLEYGYFVLDGIAPGIQAEASGGDGLLTTGLTLATLRLVPVRAAGLSLYVVGKAGRIFIGDGHEDGWAAGGEAGVIYFAGSRVGFRLGYQLLQLFPSDFCQDLTTKCRLQGLSLGVVAGF